MTTTRLRYMPLTEALLIVCFTIMVGTVICEVVAADAETETEAKSVEKIIGIRRGGVRRNIPSSSSSSLILLSTKNGDNNKQFVPEINNNDRRRGLSLIRNQLNDAVSQQPKEGEEADSSIDVVYDGCESGHCWDNTICEWISSCDVVECGEYNEFCEKENENNNIPQREDDTTRNNDRNVGVPQHFFRNQLLTPAADEEDKNETEIGKKDDEESPDTGLNFGGNHLENKKEERSSFIFEGNENNPPKYFVPMFRDGSANQHPSLPPLTPPQQHPTQNPPPQRPPQHPQKWSKSMKTDKKGSKGNNV